MTLLDLPQEILGCIVSFLEPVDIVEFGLVNHKSQDFINPSNQLLWRKAFLQVFDDPEIAWNSYPPSYTCPRREWDWLDELKRRFRAIRALNLRFPRDDEPDLAEEHLQAVLSIIDTSKYALSPIEIAQGKLSSVDDRSSLNVQILQNLHQNIHGLERLVFDSRRKDNVPDHEIEYTPGRPMTRSRTMAAREGTRPEAASRLHTLFGLTMRERLDSRFRGAARRKVYNWELTNRMTDYGPFDDDGKVNWSLLEGACSAICRNFEVCVDGRIAVPGGLAYAIPHRTLVDPTVPEDWARVTGVWLGTYAFLDYADLFAFNAGTNLGLGVPPTLEDEPEACGDLMRMETKLDYSVKTDPKLQTNVPMSEDLPPLYFTGQSRGTGYHNHPITAVKGLAALVKGGREVRWKFIVAYSKCFLKMFEKRSVTIAQILPQMTQATGFLLYCTFVVFTCRSGC